MRGETVLFFFMFAVTVLAATKVADPYKILGVKREAGSDEIKAAFRKRTKKYHPDLNTDPNAKDKYAKVVNAYELLKDPQRKRTYDLTGTDQPQPQRGFQHPGFGFQNINIEDLFSSFGGFGDPTGGMGGKQRGQRGRTFTFSFGGMPGGFQF